MARRVGLQTNAVTPAAIRTANPTPPPNNGRGRGTPASGAITSAASNRLATSSSRLNTAAPTPTAIGALRRVRASTTKAASPLGPGRTRLAPQLLSVTARIVRIRRGCPLPRSSRYRQARAEMKAKAASAASSTSPGETSDSVSPSSAGGTARSTRKRSATVTTGATAPPRPHPPPPAATGASSVSTRKRILVTGGAGFIGLHTVQRLVAEGFSVLVLDDLRHACGEPLPPSVEL